MTSETLAATSIEIRNLKVSNYRSLDDDVEVDFGRFTALVGTNGSGKSNVLDVFRFLREALTFGLEPAVSRRLGINRLRRASPTKPRAVKISVELEHLRHWRARYTIQINAATGGRYRVERETLYKDDGIDSRVLLDVYRGIVRSAPAGLSPAGSELELTLPSLAGSSDIRPIIDCLRTIRVHNIYPQELRVPQSVGSAPPLDETGSNWCAVLRTLDRDGRNELKLGLQKVTGDIRDFRVESSGGFYTAEFEHALEGHSEPRWFSAGQESDGTLRLAGILTALLQKPLIPLIGIEEPEITINPGLLPLIYDYMKAASRDSQVVITTHSPDLLDLMDVEDVRVVRRESGVTRVGKLAADQKATVRDSLMSLGSLLRTSSVRIEGEPRKNLLDELLDDEA